MEIVFPKHIKKLGYAIFHTHCAIRGYVSERF